MSQLDEGVSASVGLARASDRFLAKSDCSALKGRGTIYPSSKIDQQLCFASLGLTILLPQGEKKAHNNLPSKPILSAGNQPRSSNKTGNGRA